MCCRLDYIASMHFNEADFKQLLLFARNVYFKVFLSLINEFITKRSDFENVFEELSTSCVEDDTLQFG